MSVRNLARDAPFGAPVAILGPFVVYVSFA